jgi:2-polyprenyl-6-methoxyphenol hydroxylase-like FAD-dependent oxidoreductase
MRSVAVVGAGQAGLLLGIGLLDRGFKVTLLSDRTAEEIRHGPVPAGAVVFDDALSVERDLGISFWGEATHVHAIHVDVVEPGGKVALTLESPVDRPGLCVDQRLKSYRWMNEFEKRGGRLAVKPAAIADLESLAAENDLVVVATGKGPMSSLFPRDAERSRFDAPPRHLGMVVVKGMGPWKAYKGPGVRFFLLPGVGEMFSAPFYSKDEIQGAFLGFEPLPGGPMDRFESAKTPDARLALAKELFRELLPEEAYEAVRDATLVDEKATLAGSLVPAVRKAAGKLPSGAHVMGLADAVNLHDPLAAQGANNAAKAAKVAIRRIAERGDEPFDAAWMADVFEEIWQEAQYANQLCEKFLAPPEPHVFELLGAASQIPAVAHRFCNGFTRPRDLFPWFVDPTEARRYLQSFGPPPAA